MRVRDDLGAHRLAARDLHELNLSGQVAAWLLQRALAAARVEIPVVSDELSKNT
jgi:hypothetical protein